jgi:hypothetical protein
MQQGKVCGVDSMQLEMKKSHSLHKGSILAAQQIKHIEVNMDPKQLVDRSESFLGALSLITRIAWQLL